MYSPYSKYNTESAICQAKSSHFVHLTDFLAAIRISFLQSTHLVRVAQSARALFVHN